jgi:flagellar hook-basal body complex protein FliE
LQLEGLGKALEIDGGGEAISAPSDKAVMREMSRQGMDVSQISDAGAAGGQHAPGAGFADVLRNSVDKVNEFQVQADHAIKEMVAGRNKNIHETLLAVERADSSLKLMMQVRNKALDAYREIMRMQV